MIPSSPIKKDDLFQITTVVNKIDHTNLQIPVNTQIFTQKSKNQVIVFIFFITVILISSFLQCQILNSYNSNNYVEEFYGNFPLNPYDLNDEINKTSKFLIKTIYSLNINRLNLSSELSYIPITNLRIFLKLRCVNNLDITCENTAPFQIENNIYYYDYKLSGYSIFIEILQNRTLESLYKTIDDLISQKFFNLDTIYITFDISFINPTTLMITYSELIYSFSQMGVLSKDFKNFSFRYDYYQTPLDVFRAICEVLFFFFYTFYLIAYIMSFYYEIKHSKLIKEKNEKIHENEQHGNKNNCYIFCSQIFRGFWNFFTRLENFINLLNFLQGFFIILLWLKFISSNEVKDTLTKVDYQKIGEGQISPDFENFNDKIKNKEDLQNNGYYYLIGSFLFIQLIRLIIDLMTFSAIGRFYLYVIYDVFQKVLLFLLFLFVFFAGFAIFLKNIFGLNITALSDGYVAGLYLFKILLSDDSQIEAMWGQSPLITTFFYIIYFLIIVFTLINMFLVITNNEFFSIHQTMQQVNNESSIKKSKKSPFDYKLCFIAKIKNFWKSISLSFFYCFNKTKYVEQLKQKEIFQEQINQESKTYSELDFNTEFSSFLKESNKSANRALTEVERFAQKKEKTKKFVIFIWKTLIMTITFIIFAVLITYYFDSSSNFSIINDVNMKVTFSPSPPETESDLTYQNLLQIDSRAQCINFLKNIFPSYFTQYIFVNDNNSTKMSSYATNSAILENFYVINDIVRLTIRKRKYEPITNELRTIFPYKIASTFARNSRYTDSENTSDIFIPQFNRSISYNSEESYQGLGGYVFYEKPANDSFSNLISVLFDSGFFDIGLNSIVVDFILASFTEKGKFIKTNIYFEMDDSGTIQTHVYTMTFFRNAIEEYSDVLILTTLILISILYVFFFLKTASDVLSRKHNYDTWYTLYIRNRLPKVLLYHRERKNAEILRKIKFMFNYKAMINVSFLIFGGGFLIAVGVYELQIFFFEANAMIFGQSVKNFFYDKIFFTPNSDSYIINHYGIDMNTTALIMTTNGFVIFFASCSAFVLASKIIFYYSKNESFYLILQTLRLSFLDFLAVLIIFLAIKIAFVVCTYFSFGMKYAQFSNFDTTYYNLLVPMVYFENLGVAFEQDDKILLVMLFLPYFITFKLVWLNLIISILYKNFKIFHDQKKISDDDKKLNITVKQFFYISLDMLKIFKKKATFNTNQSKNHDIIIQTLQKVNIHLPFISMKNSIKNCDRLKNVNTWSDVCSEEIKYEYDSRKFLKDKCDEIIKNTVQAADEFGEDPNYLQLNQITFRRVPIEFELRKVFWEYFRIAHLYFHRYDYYLQQKIDEIKGLKEIDELKKNNKFKKDKNFIEKINESSTFEEVEEKTNKEIVLILEEDLKILKNLRQEEDNLRKIMEKKENL